VHNKRERGAGRQAGGPVESHSGARGNIFMGPH